MSDWRDSVKKWRVEFFFGKWIVVPDQSDVFCYMSRWRWLALREARRLAHEHGGDVVANEQSPPICVKCGKPAVGDCEKAALAKAGKVAEAADAKLRAANERAFAKQEGK